MGTLLYNHLKDIGIFPPIFGQPEGVWFHDGQAVGYSEDYHEYLLLKT